MVLVANLYNFGLKSPTNIVFCYTTLDPMLSTPLRPD